MLVLCRNCGQQFRPQKKPAGQVITHQKCHAIFKVVYVGCKIHCPHCRALLILQITEENDVYAGTPLAAGAESASRRHPVAPRKRRACPDDEPTEVDLPRPGARPFLSSVTRAARSKKVKRAVGSFVGSLGLFFFYLVLSNGLHREMPTVDSKVHSAPPAAVALTASPALAATAPAPAPRSAIAPAPRITADNTIEVLDLPPRKTISSNFGFRKHPLSRHWKFHNGIDIAMPAGSPVTAALSGRVVFSGYDEAIGNYIKIEHADGYLTIYGHNAKNLVAEGQLVEQGEVIALVGMTGMATGPHIHFELRRNGQRVNPLLHKKLKLEKMYLEVL